LTPEDSVTTRALVHDAALTSPSLVEEPFLKQGQGSAFVSRANELVVITANAAGLPLIQQKIVQLVERGFHSIIVSLNGVKTLEQNHLKLLLKARGYVENWAGYLKVCDVSAELFAQMKAVQLDKELSPAGTRAEAVEAFRREVTGDRSPPPPVTPPKPAASKASASDLAFVSGSSDSEGPLKLDWDQPKATAPASSAAPAAAPAASAASDGDLPQVDVAELVVPAEELPKLRREIEGVLSRGKKYVTMRLSFKKRMRSEDVTILTEARDTVAQAGGQLVLASLQSDVATWLKLLDYDREFLIFEDADQAELAHRRHAAGIKSPVRAPAKSAAPEPGFQIVGRTASSVTVRPKAKVGGPVGSRRVAQVALVTLTRAGLPGLKAEVERLAGQGVRDVCVDLKALDVIRGERVEALGEAAAAARAKGTRLTYGQVGRELRAFLKLVGMDGKLPLFDEQDAALLAHAEQLSSQGSYDELEISLARSELREPAAAAPIKKAAPPQPAVSELAIADSAISFDEKGDEPVSAEEGVLRFELQKAKAEAEAFHKELTTMRTKLDDAQGKITRLESGGKQQKLAENERDAAKAQAAKTAAELDTARKELERAKAAAQTASAASTAVSTAGGAEAAKIKSELEQAKARIEFLDARYREADYARKELEKIAHSSDDARKKTQTQIEAGERKLKEAEARFATLQGERELFSTRVNELEAERTRLEAKVQQLGTQESSGPAKAEVDKRIRELEAHAAAGKEHFKRVAELEREKSALATRAQALEAQANGYAKRVKELEQSTATSAPSGGGGALGERVAKLEREKAEILLESKQEIERLTREQETLREELESAGEMIERLGKELELT
jgi:anti-anti-sigma regulatory factor